MSCGETGKLHFHHKNHDDRDDRVGNLVVLCRKCHMAHHSEYGKNVVVPTSIHRINGSGVAMARFDAKYKDKGGVDTLRNMAVTQGLTLQKIADHFGVSREYIRQRLATFKIRDGVRAGGGHYTIPKRESVVERKRKNIYKWIIDNNMMIGEFAVKSGINAPRLSIILTGKANPNYAELSRIREVTGLSFEDIMEEGSAA